ncbi:type II/IV secretion system protein [Candidatus Kaiserbacteria bacterium]|nr:type II/IV secretion system protein [Candidatus Kaiserbacteria bacterium]
MPGDAVERELVRGRGLSVITLVDHLIEAAQEKRASDIHLDPLFEGVRVRFRIDGVLQDVYRLPREVRSEIVSRIKVLASLRTDEHQTAQDGRFRHSFGGNAFVDIRVSIAPTYHGENVVLRLLSDVAQEFTLQALGFGESDRRKIIEAIRRPSGMILVTGPTGSGKTTTLYTLIKMLNAPDISVITIEDPIEYGVAGVEQMQVNTRAGLTFATGLRTILRQDPNIIMVGEIRDAETASIAVNTALTGHLLLSTLHTNDAATTLPRLLDLRVESFLVASTISLAIGQRLVRKLCPACKQEFKASRELAKSLAAVSLNKPIAAGERLQRPKGCKKCGGTGYHGRISINEVLIADAKIREAILARAPSSELKRIAIKGGMTTMLEDGLTKVRAGVTSVEEVLRVIHE